MTLPTASQSLISPVVTETERQKKAKELPAQSSPSPLLLCAPLASSQRWAGPGQSSCRLPCAQLAVIRLFLLGGRGWGWGVGGGGRDGGAGWGVEKGMRCTVGASQKAVGREGERERERESTLVLFCNERKEKRMTLRGCVWKWAPYPYPKTEKGIEDSSLHSRSVPLGCLLQCSPACLFVSFFSRAEVVSCGS